MVCLSFIIVKFIKNNILKPKLEKYLKDCSKIIIINVVNYDINNGVLFN